ncbi:hypothetical protein AN3242.2 [Aspergillus nidulans FGSC A4]|uniref:AB hydrolase-1 domain-containing protein n=1 Tax=Emericella nidulans (strain FGSC A4 / ATCC 38163 / CBS 112.46 / NRRL 194 / M139) TaxID=227321 RepID=Q5B888_EMENI|nr:hypothetical protein [Aspergillus nidulans FGSC A4]EAA63143.1 hypothetical protein AN3242.2 [Aspergillus nidulans FGSC A4]CBF83114.1 TPA: conserved hypothetical protein [Aspergillus nidulans FGSC A4]|eukprot:XP_660846.1 hypothetical protein AN3242.2 [Aspergillus nidulans FGSC A4]
MARVSAPANPRTTIIILHGAWHNPTHYYDLAAVLRALGHKVLIPRLLFMSGARPANSGLYTDSDHIRSYAESLADAGHCLVVLMHTYSGQPLAANFADDGTVEYRDVGERMVGPGLSKEDLESYIARLKPWNGQALYQEIREVTRMDIPVSYILSLQGMMLPIAYQNVMVAGIGAAGGKLRLLG